MFRPITDITLFEAQNIHFWLLGTTLSCLQSSLDMISVVLNGFHAFWYNKLSQDYFVPLTSGISCFLKKT